MMYCKSILSNFVQDSNTNHIFSLAGVLLGMVFVDRPEQLSLGATARAGVSEREPER